MWFWYIVCLNQKICTSNHFADCTESQFGHILS